MDIVLERILSLIPKKPDGKYVHGAKAEFAKSIGFKNGTILTDWEALRSDSYRNYLYEISDKYNVSVEWLKGETDDKTKKAAPLAGSDLNPKYFDLTPENRALIDQMIDQLSKAQSAD